MMWMLMNWSDFGNCIIRCNQVNRRDVYLISNIWAIQVTFLLICLCFCAGEWMMFVICEVDVTRKSEILRKWSKFWKLLLFLIRVPEISVGYFSCEEYHHDSRLWKVFELSVHILSCSNGSTNDIFYYLLISINFQNISIHTSLWFLNKWCN